ncbi:MAG: putative DNA-binding domain-containing protein [Rubrivivax sp.]
MTLARPGPSPHAAFAAALLDPAAPVPAGLVAWNGSDPAERFAVYRNNVVHSLIMVLSDTFPVVRELVGEDFFRSMAQRFIVAHPPTSALMHRYGEAFPAWLDGFEPAAPLAYLPDLARLELARLRAFHAADATAIDAQQLADTLREPEQLASTVLQLSPSLNALASPHPVVSLWEAHQWNETRRDARLADIDLGLGESALVFRAGDDALVLGAAHDDAALALAMAAGAQLGHAVSEHPAADLARLLGLLLEHGLVVGVVGASARTPT